MPIREFFQYQPDEDIDEIEFKKDAEERFRNIETKVLSYFSSKREHVIATGGGIVEIPSNCDALKQTLTIFLNVEPGIIMQRLTADPKEIEKRPLLQDGAVTEKLNSLLDRRLSKYMNADVTVNINENEYPHVLCSKLIQVLLNELSNNIDLSKRFL